MSSITPTNFRGSRKHFVVGREEDRITFFAQLTGPYYALVEGLIAGDDVPVDGQGKRQSRNVSGETAFEYAEAARARLLSEKLAGLGAAEAGRGVPAAIRLEERTAVERVQASLRDGKRLEESSAYRDFERLVEKLRRQYPGYAERRYPSRVAARDVPVEVDEVVVAYALLPRQVVCDLGFAAGANSADRSCAGRSRPHRESNGSVVGIDATR